MDPIGWPAIRHEPASRVNRRAGLALIEAGTRQRSVHRSVAELIGTDTNLPLTATLARLLIEARIDPEKIRASTPQRQNSVGDVARVLKRCGNECQQIAVFNGSITRAPVSRALYAGAGTANALRRSGSAQAQPAKT